MVKRFVGLCSLLSACVTPPPARPAAPVSAGPPPVTSASAATPSASAGAPPQPYRECGELGCKEFPDAAAAFAYVLREQPRVLAVGEAHAQASGPASDSTTRRFMADLLPRLAPRASDLVIELWLANGSCGKVEKQVQKQQAEVTAPQATTNQNDFLELGHRAKALGIMPHALLPTCEQYEKIAHAGAEDVAEMLVMLKTVTERDVKSLLEKRGPERLVVAYGGAMHNDLVPREGRAEFSFGPALASFTEGRYVELDLVMPEQIKDTDAWRALPWYPHHSRESAGKGAYLYSWAPRAYALLFPRADRSPRDSAP